MAFSFWVGGGPGGLPFTGDVGACGQVSTWRGTIFFVYGFP